ncbi:hypothetical protein ACQEPB_00305 [Novosphingobium fluoreni]|uniref:hypothetical protein n=1 Tax=Novosphingobium fluoreni TaxID=1391222 RepID=UPI003DA050F6
MATQPVFSDVPAWPDPKPAAAVFGHNKPPLEELIPAEFRTALLAEKPEFLTRMDDAVGAADRAVANDDETLGRCGDLVKLYRALLSHVAETHKAVKEPHLTAGRLVDAEKNALVERIETAKRKVEGIGNTYVAERTARENAERARREAEEREAADRALAAQRAADEAERSAKLAAENATSDAEREKAAEIAAAAQAEANEAIERAALAAAPASRNVEPVRSDAGAAVSSRQEHTSKVEDYAKAFKAVKDDPKVLEAIDKAVQRLVKAGKREIVGVRIWPVAKANFR